MEFFNRTGKMAIGSRLRLLTDKITEDATQLYKLYNVELLPKWFPVFYVLTDKDNTITAIANEIGHSHPSVSKIVGEMTKAGIVTSKKDKADGRMSKVSLTKKGKEAAKKIRHQYEDVGNAIEVLSGTARHDLWQAIEEWEFLLSENSLLQRVLQQKKQRESRDIKIVNYQPKYQQAFKTLNEEWIAKYFEMEEADRKVLDNPKTEIINKGGQILVALYDDKPVGVCALLKMNDPVYDYELIKMAVSPDMQGKNIGWLLGQAIIDKARSLGASAVYLESNTILKAAISLYQKLGFKKVVGHATPYKRCNIQMELRLK